MTCDAAVARKGQWQAVTSLPDAAFDYLRTVFGPVIEQARRHYTLQGALAGRSAALTG